MLKSIINQSNTAFEPVLARVIIIHPDISIY